MSNSLKRKADADTLVQPGKRIKILPNAPAIETAQAPAPLPPTTVPDVDPKPSRVQRKKLPPQRPFPSVPASTSATVPYSARTDGKNFICITRKTSLGAYMRRCKDVVLKDGYKTLHLCAMGAAIPLLIQLSAALPPILPYAASDIVTEITTGTTDVQDELIPDDDDHEPTFETRSKSTLSIVMKIGDGEKEPSTTNRGGRKKRKQGPPANTGSGVGSKNRKGKPTSQAVYQEPEQNMEE